ncbi:hypothetical protein QFZ86_005076 [Pseudomonas plecoglossicida]
MLWRFNYRKPVIKKRISIGFGTYPELSLANARKMAVEARELLAQGIDPKMQRNALNEAKCAKTEHSFENVATAWFELTKDSVTPSYTEDIAVAHAPCVPRLEGEISSENHRVDGNRFVLSKHNAAWKR